MGMSQTAMDFGEQWGSHKARLSSWCTFIASIQDPMLTSSLLNILRLEGKDRNNEICISEFASEVKSKAFQTCHSELLQVKPLSRLKECILVRRHVRNTHFQSNCPVSRTWQIKYLSHKLLTVADEEKANKTYHFSLGSVITGPFFMQPIYVCGWSLSFPRSVASRSEHKTNLNTIVTQRKTAPITTSQIPGLK